MAGYRQTYGGYGPQQPYHGTYQPESHQNSFLPYPTPGGYRDREAPYILDRPYEPPPLLDVSELLARDPPPLIVPRPLFDDREGVRDGRGFGSGDRFYPEPGILYVSLSVCVCVCVCVCAHARVDIHVQYIM